MKKKFISLVIAIAMILSLIPSNNICAANIKSGDWEYKESESGVVLVGYYGSDQVTVPIELDGKAVVAIGENCFYNYSSIDVVIPAEIQRVERCAFQDCGYVTVIFEGRNTITSDFFAAWADTKIYCYLDSATYRSIDKSNNEHYTIEFLDLSMYLYDAYIDLNMGESYDVLYHINNGDGTEQVEFVSSDPEIASVDEYGKLKAIQPGSTYVTVTLKKSGEIICYDECHVTVLDPILSADKLTIYLNQKSQLSVINVMNMDIKWSSSKKTVATVNSKGMITAKKKGSAVITATVNGVKLKCKVTVKNPSMSKSRTLTKGFSDYIYVYGGDGKRIKWSSSNSKICSVNKNGKLTGKKLGTCVIKAKVDGQTLSCKVKVTENAWKSTQPKAMTDISFGSMCVDVRKMEFQGTKLKITYKVINKTGNTIKGFEYMIFNMSKYGSNIFVKEKYRVTCKVKAYSQKTFTVTLNTGSLYKQLDLRDKGWTLNTSYRPSY
ncbi:MAG: Ig-like domain-containing protein [Lachnospiraceae bacterium]